MLNSFDGDFHRCASEARGEPRDRPGRCRWWERRSLQRASSV